MRASSTLLVFVLAAVSASPALAAPVNTGFCNRYPGACSHIGRDVQAPADSEALSFGTIFDIGKGIFDVGKTLFGGSGQQQQQRDVSGAINLSQLRGPELGPPVAFKGADGVWRQFGTGAPTTPPQGLQRREFVEFMARATAEADESGSLGLGTIFDIGKGIFDVGKEIFGGNSQQKSREFEEFMARATAEADESGSLGLGTIFDIGKGIFDVGKEIFSGNGNQQSREFEDLLARAATETDETGSLGLGTIFDIGKGIFDVGKTLFGGNSNQQSRDSCAA
ncbi:hypothetical protein PHLGIDRAFT_131375 [Phlebiopsis gigantea 11061_1 CR5-6]|uniref:Uncharacterized protein n=1 Tax=Phlebiopsis gigantea (strain 11061_1 CR5-6) TaxID=745531 RepID=A0A0C3RY77_PHLG1|nr:hypothetical protein PHLGIDRAFT_131375 [Phlebiopsis gigantea 11061_1 CR5-6]